MISLIGRGSDNGGFTLLEVMTVIVILLILLVGSVPYFGKIFITASLNATARDISKALKTARSYAVTKRAIYNVVFDTSVEPNRYYITDNGDRQVGRGEVLPLGVIISDISFLPEDDRYKASFGPSGALVISGGGGMTENAVWIRKKSDGEYNTSPANFRRISVDSITGRVKIDEIPPPS